MKAREMDLPAARIEPFDQLDHLSLRPARLEAWNHNSDRHRSGERHDAHLSKRNATTVQKKRRDFRFSRLPPPLTEKRFADVAFRA